MFKKTPVLALMLLYWASLNAQPLRLMTYNIRLDVASDGVNAWPNRRDDLAAQVLFYAPDVLGIQEALPQQVDFLKEQLTNYQCEGIGREGVGKGEASSIFFNKKRFLLQKSHTFWLSPTPDSISMGWDAACLRVCTAVQLKDQKSKQTFWVLNTHLDHIGVQARLNGVKVIQERIKKMNPEGFPVVLMGDFNATPESDVMALVKSQMTDCRALSVQKPFGPAGTFNGFKFNEPVTKLIDYILLSANTPWQVQKHAVLSDSKDLRYPSDHLPVFVEVEMGKKLRKKKK